MKMPMLCGATILPIASIVSRYSISRKEQPVPRARPTKKVHGACPVYGHFARQISVAAELRCQYDQLASCQGEHKQTKFRGSKLTSEQGEDNKA